MTNPWRMLGVRARSTFIGFVIALVVLWLAISSILARHSHEPDAADIRVTTGS